MIFFLTILILPLLIGIAAKLISKQICWKEFAIICGTQVVVAGVSAAICYYQSTSDTEIWNSSVASKKQEWVSCSHSYSCNCRTVYSGSGKNRTSSTKCDTCYEHSNDWAWAVYDKIGHRFEINRVDRRGTSEPPRFTATQMGEPTSRGHSYENYIKAAPDTLFRHQGQVKKYQGRIPTYPDSTWDYYRLDRLVLVNGAEVPDRNYWRDDISQLNADIGSSKQANIIVVVTKNMPPDYFYALEQAWVGGKKNDIIAVVNLNASRKADWVQVMAWDNNELLKVKIRDELMDKTTIERWDVVDVLKWNIEKYRQRKPMADFEYLTASITPTMAQWIVTIIIGSIISIALSIFLHHAEVFPEYRNHY